MGDACSLTTLSEYSPSSSNKPRRDAQPPATGEENSSQTHGSRNGNVFHSDPLCQYLPTGLKTNTLILEVVTLGEARRSSQREGERWGEMELHTSSINCDKKLSVRQEFKGTVRTVYVKQILL